MMKGEENILQGQILIAAYEAEDRDLDMILEEDDQDSSSSDLSSWSSSSSESDESSLFDLSELMSNLPIKRGLSKFYQGKSQSFTALARVTGLEDLAKKVSVGGYGRRIKACKSYGGDLNLNNKHKSSPIKSPRSTISKKSSSSSCIMKGVIKTGGFVLSNMSSISGVKLPLNVVQV